MTTPQQRWNGPDGVGVRGTIVVIAGRGETPEVYHRFGARLAADAYQVAALASDGRSTDELARDVRALLDDPWFAGPLVVAGSDTGAAQATSIAGRIPEVAAVLLTGLLTDESRLPEGWDAQIEAKTGCPTHQGVLRRTATVVEPTISTGNELAALTIPALVVVGSDDRVTSVDSALKAAAALPNATIKVVEGGRHDLFNDATHRSVAATVVLFLERLKLGADLPEIVREVAASSIAS